MRAEIARLIMVAWQVAGVGRKQPVKTGALILKAAFDALIANCVIALWNARHRLQRDGRRCTGSDVLIQGKLTH